MKLFGIGVGDLLALATLFSLVFGLIATGFKTIVVAPLTNSIDELTNQLKESKADRSLLRKDLTNLSIDVVEVRDETKALKDSYKAHLKTYHKI